MSLNRRSFLAAAAAGTASSALAQRDYSSPNPVRYPDPDIISLDKRFDKIKIGNTPIRRLSMGYLWAEGPAWNGVGKYLVFSDIPNNAQMRWIDDEGGRTTLFRNNSNYSNGNTFDYEGRQLSCEHLGRRVVRYEQNGTITVLADTFQGKKLNAPNDIVVAPDGAVWFTDPGYGILGNYEAAKAPMELKEAIYRLDTKTGKLDKVADDMFKPNGLCFSPDYKKLYIADSGITHYPNAPRNVRVYDVDGASLKNGKQAISMDMPGKPTTGFADGIRCDIEGNIWAGSGWVGAGYDGVQIFAPDGQKIGQILLPEICANICFGGPKRNRLFMCGAQSLYAVYVETQGAHIC